MYLQGENECSGSKGEVKVMFQGDLVHEYFLEEAAYSTRSHRAPESSLSAFALPEIEESYLHRNKNTLFLNPYTRTHLRPYTMEGTCQCGKIIFTTPLTTPQALYICHCTECRHQSSSAYGMTAVFPFFTLSGNISTYTRPNPNGVTKGYFCTNCGSRIYHQHIDKQGNVSESVSVKAGCLKNLDREMMRGAVSLAKVLVKVRSLIQGV